MTSIHIPEHAPYSDRQRAWLSGFFAGMGAQMVRQAEAGGQAGRASLPILYGSQTGNAEGLAREAARAAKAHGLNPVVNSLDAVDMAWLAAQERLLVITSTYGEGEMPDNAKLFWEALSADQAPALGNLRYAVLALGDTGYDLFCQAGKDLDNRLAALGARRLHPRLDCDVDFESAAQSWIATVVPQLSGATGTGVFIDLGEPAADKPQYHKKNPFPARLTVNRLLTGQGSSKETRHYELAIAGSGLSYEAGDALCVIPSNCPQLVADIIGALGCGGDEDEPVNGASTPLREALRSQFEIKAPSKELVREIALRSGDQTLNNLLAAEDKSQLAAYLWGRDILDLLRQFPQVEFSAAEFLALLKPLQHRAYSIASSSKLHPDSVHLTVASVRYQSHGRLHKGVCSTFLADLVDERTAVPCFFSANKVFRVPDDDGLPMVMVGPGTGIAPFRAFLQERQARGAGGKNWLFFGDRNAATDFIYQEELMAMRARGLLTRLDLAFSRDQAQKIYVQDRMREHGAELFAWLEQGGHFYVCGDAYQMAKDVDLALHELVARHGNLDADAAADYVNQLKKDRRYVRDVY